MSEAAFMRSFDAAFFKAWAGVVGSLAGVYVSPGGTATLVQVLKESRTVDFGDAYAPVSLLRTVVIFQRAQVEPEIQGTVQVDGVTYTLAQRLEDGDESLSKWMVQP